MNWVEVEAKARDEVDEALRGNRRPVFELRDKQNCYIEGIYFVLRLMDKEE